MADHPTRNAVTLRHTPLLNVVAFLMAFCSISYELIIGAKLSRIYGEGMFLYPLCIAVFILFMGIGSAVWYRKTDYHKILPARRLIVYELMLTVLGALSLLFIDLSQYEALYYLNVESIPIGLVFAALIGFISGQELPLLFHICSAIGIPPKQVRRMIFYDYLASFCASVTCALLLFAMFGFLKSAIFIAQINLAIVVLLLITIRATDVNPGFRKGVVWITGCLAALFLLVSASLDQLENQLIRRAFIGSRNALLLEKRYTPYQQILLFVMRKDYAPVQRAQHDILSHPEDYYLFAVLNGSLQFFEPFEIDADPDHTFLFDPYIQLNPHIRKVLILGGGDGLPARQAVRYPSLTHIDMVDIDAQWVRFSMTNPFMRQKNRGALSDPRLTIHLLDAFKWILTAEEKYDLIIVDFPSEPSSLAKIRTNSIQFFRDLGRILSDQGTIVMHSNTRSDPTKLHLIGKTARMANLFPLWGYKEDSLTWSEVEQIVLFKTDSARSNFLKDYTDRYLRLEPFKTVRDQFGTLTYHPLEESDHWISFYDPLVSRLPLGNQVQQMMKALNE